MADRLGRNKPAGEDASWPPGKHGKDPMFKCGVDAEQDRLTLRLIMMGLERCAALPSQLEAASGEGGRTQIDNQREPAFIAFIEIIMPDASPSRAFLGLRQASPKCCQLPASGGLLEPSHQDAAADGHVQQTADSLWGFALDASVFKLLECGHITQCEELRRENWLQQVVEPEEVVLLKQNASVGRLTVQDCVRHPDGEKGLAGDRFGLLEHRLGPHFHEH